MQMAPAWRNHATSAFDLLKHPKHHALPATMHIALANNPHCAVTNMVASRPMSILTGARGSYCATFTYVIATPLRTSTGCKNECPRGARTGVHGSQELSYTSAILDIGCGRSKRRRRVAWCTCKLLPCVKAKTHGQCCLECSRFAGRRHSGTIPSCGCRLWQCTGTGANALRMR